METSYDPAPGERFEHLWGYRDTRFEFCGETTVRVTGDRYPLSGAPLPHFIPFAEKILGVALRPQELGSTKAPPTLPLPERHSGFLEDLERHFDAGQMSAEDHQRLSHSHGQLSVDEVYRIVSGRAPERVVDLVVYPESEAQLLELVRLADDHGVVLIPYGGGTNVSGALLCPGGERRMVVSVNMSRLNRILELDRANNRAVVQAGITGKELEQQLAEAGLTCGHIPDSVELSTLGGWIATYASGMKRNRYGNIEDIVLDATLISPRGELRTVPVNPRASLGIDPRRLLFGSEGCLGVITRAVIQVHPLPAVRRYASFVFADLSAGLAFLRAVQGSAVRPASIRLASNIEFRLGQALKREESRSQALLSRLKSFYLLRVKGFDPQQLVAGTLVLEGSPQEVRHQWRVLARLLRDMGGVSAGAEAGRRGYQLTFAIAYIRDFLSRFDILGETFETSALWDRVPAITDAVERELHEQCRAHGVPGRPYLSFRVSQSYHTGACIYFTMGFSGRGLERADEIYQRIEHRLREVILEQGGSLSHHHGIGKVRQAFVPRVHSPEAIGALRAVKQRLDPNNVFGAGNNCFGGDS
ncbi:FAD-binding oxidoreductase [Aquisalimonas sp.]|uniref:FAD-binding oxidoreductase n=1 Tax=Aquisalimonas sp. TaxID=1872621 RepID=UPI0025BF4CA8|nr:FAD-binding oxidoreductase [Aquisalimonas sp.]